MPWLGPYNVEVVFENSTCHLRGKNGDLKKRQHISNLKPCNMQSTENTESQIFGQQGTISDNQIENGSVCTNAEVWLED